MAEDTRKIPALSLAKSASGAWGVISASHNTQFKSYPSTLPYVVSAGGCRRIVAGVGTGAGAVNALIKHGERAASEFGGERRWVA
jgi:subtilase family serine protease